jgi:hypothetical protein
MDPELDPDEGIDENVDGADELVLGPGGLDDPETEWHLDGIEDSVPDLSSLGPGELFLLRPGEEPQRVAGIPKPRHLQIGIAFSTDKIILCRGKQRDSCRNRVGFAPGPAEDPAAKTMTVVFIEHRASGNRMRSRKYVVLTTEDGSLLGWLDYSDSWGFASHLLQGLAEQGGLTFEIERYPNELAFQSAHPTWVD